MPTALRARRPIVLAFSAAVLAIAMVAGQQGEPSAALFGQIDRIFKDKAYQAPRFGPARWLPDGTAYAVVEPPSGGGDGSEIVRYDAVTGARTVLVPSSRLVPPGRGHSALEIEDYTWSADGRRLLIFTNTKRVWRDNTRGDYWVLDLEGGSLQRIGRDAPESSLMFAKFSPDGSRVAYVRASNIFVERLGDGHAVPLTRDGSETTINGTSDWVYEEELGLRDGFRWSPDGGNIAYWQFDSTGVGIFSIIDNTSALYPTITRIPYPKVGTTNSAARIGVVSAEGGETRWMRPPGDPRNNYLARMEWIDKSALAIHQLNRLQNRNDLLRADAATGAVTRLFRDESQTWLNVDDVRPVENGKAYLWLSERDGWEHVYRVPSAGGGAKLITRFEADVPAVLGTDEATGWLYFIASPSDATRRYLFRSKLDGTGTPQRVTPTDQVGTHSYDLAPGGRLAFHTWSRFDMPPVTEVVELPAHRSLRRLTDSSTLEAELGDTLKPSVEFLKVDIGGGVVLDGWMLKPASFDPSRKYPVLVYVYGEPAGQTVLDRWIGDLRLFCRALSTAGYVVVSFDNRGTPAPRGAAWRKVVYGSVGVLSSKEQAAAVRVFVAEHGFADGERIGVWGWSGGGTNTLNAMFRYPEIYKVGIAIAPVPDQKLYDTIYQERYMGLPQENAEGYRMGSAINFAEGLKGRLLLIHGTGDDNVHYQGTQRLVNRLVELGKPFDLMVYPNRTHSINEGPGTSPHLFRLVARYFLEHLPPGGL